MMRLAPTPPPRCLAAALAYAKIGGRVLPIRPGTKAPCTEHGVKDATTDPDVIRGWYERWPDAGVAIAMGSGLRVADVDPRNGGDVTLRALEAEHGTLQGPTVLTAGGGLHVYMSGGGPKVLVGPGLELLGEGGYAVAPPTIGPSGVAYTWDLDLSVAEVPMHAVPSWLLEPPGAKESEAGAGERDAVWSVLGAAFEAASMVGKRLADGRRAVLCPWSHEHSEGKDYDTSTVLFPPKPGAELGWFHCSHAHCHGRGAKEALAVLPREAVRVAEERYPRVRRDVLPPGNASQAAVLEQHQERAPATSSELWTAADMADEPPPTDYLCPRIHLAPGRPFALTGYAGSGKTFLMMDLLLAIARQGMSEEAREGVNATCWGGLDVTGGGVVHLDLEVGKKGIWQRYKRLARGRGFEIQELGALLAWRSYPAFRLNQPDALTALCRMMEGRVLLAADSLKALLPGVRENDSEIADHCNLLGLASEKTGCAVVLLHHEGKPGEDGKVAAHLRGRGSSAIQGCLGAQWSVSLVKGKPPHFLIEHGKSEHDELTDPLRVRLTGSEERGPDGKSARLWIAGVQEPTREELEASRDAVDAERADFLRRSVEAQIRLWATVPEWADRKGCPGLKPMAEAIRCGQATLRPIWHTMTQGPLNPAGIRDSALAVLENRGTAVRAAWRMKGDTAS